MINYSSIVRIKTKKSYLFTVRGLYFRMDERHMLWVCWTNEEISFFTNDIKTDLWVGKQELSRDASFWYNYVPKRLAENAKVTLTRMGLPGKHQLYSALWKSTIVSLENAYIRRKHIFSVYFLYSMFVKVIMKYSTFSVRKIYLLFQGRVKYCFRKDHNEIKGFKRVESASLGICLQHPVQWSYSGFQCLHPRRHFL